MKQFIAKEKLNKKARKALNSQRRTLWDVSPVTRKIESKKRYSRKDKHAMHQDDVWRVFYKTRENESGEPLFISGWVRYNKKGVFSSRLRAMNGLEGFGCFDRGAKKKQFSNSYARFQGCPAFHKRA